MRIVNLIENTEGHNGCLPAHGLSFYVETGQHRLLMDLGPSEDTLRNAETLGIDLSGVDTVVLSHGHYDHSGGILSFAKQNDRAVIYMQENADGDYYADESVRDGEQYLKYIGIDKEISHLPNVRAIRGNYKIDEALSLFQIQKRTHELPFTNKRLLVKQGDTYVRDDFPHEQYLVIAEGRQHVLLSGCAHNGILSILDEYRRLYGGDPDLVISGFHLMKQTAYTEHQTQEIRAIAEELKGYQTKLITCHCTGLPAYEIMKDILGPQLSYCHTGDEIILS